MSLDADSPHLVGALKRLYGRKVPKLLQEAFEWSMDNGAGIEPDFTREEGVSFNPRPSRVALIIINDCELHQPEVLAAAICKCADKMPPREMTSSTPLNDKGLAAVTLALWLDRARQIHRAKSERQQEILPQLLKQAPSMIELAAEHELPIESLIKHWHERVLSKTSTERGSDKNAPA